MKPESIHRSGFTLVEVSAATSILVIALAMAMAGLVYVIRANIQGDTQNELDIDVQAAMESIKYDLRLSALDKMFFYPDGPGPYTAVSMPLARDDDGDGAVDTDEDGNIIWDKTLVYHVWATLPYQLRVTTFDPRDGALTDAERQEQLDSVVVNGNGTATHNSTSASTRVVFENLFDWHVEPQGARYDAYASSTQRDVGVNLGSCIISNGAHTFTFTVVDKNSSSSGYKIGVDSLTVSPSYYEREAEAQLPADAYSGATPVAQFMSGGSWSGNYQLYFPAGAADQYFSLSMENDRWEETNFRGTGSVFSNTTVNFDEALTPSDYVVALEGAGFNWWAYEQTGDTNGLPCGTDEFRGTAIRVLLRGEEMLSGNWILHDAARCWIAFRSGSTSSEDLKVMAAYIAECAATDVPSMDAVAGTAIQLTDMSGNTVFNVPGGSYVWTDQTPFPIEREKSYLVTFLVDNATAKGNPWKWREITDPSVPGAYVIPATNVPSAADCAAAVWSTRPDVVQTNCVLGVYTMYTTYPSNGLFTSQVFDTHLDAPSYSRVDWDETMPSGAYLDMKVRSGSSNDLSDAASWESIAAMTSPGSINPGNHRYVQFRAELRSGTGYMSTPKLEDVTIEWGGEDKMVDIAGTFTKGPDYGIFELSVDGQRVLTGVSVYLEIFEDVRGYKGTRRVTSSLTSEVTPRNTGR